MQMTEEKFFVRMPVGGRVVPVDLVSCFGDIENDPTVVVRCPEFTALFPASGVFDNSKSGEDFIWNFIFWNW